MGVQLLFTLRCLLLQEEIASHILEDTNMPELILDLLELSRPSAAALEAAADEVLDLVVSLESQQAVASRWTNRIKSFRFQRHNDDWCQRVISGDRHQDAVISSGATASAAF